MDDIEKLQRQIKWARAGAKRVVNVRTLMAGVLSGTFIVANEIEFPEPDIMHIYHCLLGRRMTTEPAVYRLSFGQPLKWVGVSHPWGVKPADIVIQEER